MKSLFFLILTLLAQGAQSARPGSIAGSVTGRNGKPAVGVRVSVVGEPAGPGKETSLVSFTETDAAGKYRLDNVPAGRYYIAAGITDGLSYLPGVAAITDATLVTVAAGATLEGKDIRLITSLVKLAGRVVRENDDPSRQVGRGTQVVLELPTPKVTISGFAPPLPPPVMVSAIAPDGSFEFRNVPSGRYPLRVTGTGLTMTAVSIVLADEDVTGYQLTVPLSAVQSMVSGTATVIGGGPLPFVRVFLTPEGGPAQNNLSALFNSVSVDSTPSGAPRPFGAEPPGRFSPGEYRVVVAGGTSPDSSLSDGFSVAAVRAGAVDLLKDALRLVPGASVEIKVELAVSSPALWKKISGRTIGVMAEGGRPASIAMSGPVKVFAAVQPDGAFEFSRVVPGSYAIDVFPIPDSLEGAFRVGVLLVGDTDLANIDIPASLFAFTVSGRAPGEAELKQSGVLGNGDSIRAFLVDQSRMRSLFSSPATTPQPGFRVRTASSGPAGPGGAVAATPSSRLGPDGEFQFKNVFPGDYRLTFSVARAGSDVIGVNTSGGTPVTVVDKDIDGLVVPVDLSGAPPAPPPPPR